MAWCNLASVFSARAAPPTPLRTINHPVGHSLPHDILMPLMFCNTGLTFDRLDAMSLIIFFMTRSRARAPNTLYLLIARSLLVLQRVPCYVISEKFEKN